MFKYFLTNYSIINLSCRFRHRADRNYTRPPYLTLEAEDIFDRYKYFQFKGRLSLPLLLCFVPIHNILIFGANSRIRFDHAAQPGGDSPHHPPPSPSASLQPEHNHVISSGARYDMLHGEALLSISLHLSVTTRCGVYLAVTIWIRCSSVPCPLLLPTVFPVHTTANVDI